MPNKSKNKRKNLHLPPGSLVEKDSDQKLQSSVSLIAYSADSFVNRPISSSQELKEVLEKIDSSLVYWINITSYQDLNLIKQIGESISIHPLVLEDISSSHQRPKLEDWQTYLFTTLRMLYTSKTNNKEIIDEQISFILGENFLISFQEDNQQDVFDVIRNRLEQNKGKVRRMQADYLMYSLIDAMVDEFFIIMDSIDADLEHIENEMEDHPETNGLLDLQQLKRKIINMKRIAMPTKEVVQSLIKSESPLILDTTDIYLRDLHDHCIQVLDSLENLRDLISSILETTRSLFNNKTNEIMKVLTMISSMFIPLTFIVGVYGMNFKYMPEIDWPYSYPICLLVMLIIAICMLFYFKRKKWW